MIDEPAPVVWVDDGTTWDHPEVVLSDGPQSVIVEPDDLRGSDMPPRSGRVGFTVTPGPVHDLGWDYCGCDGIVSCERCRVRASKARP